MDAMALGTTAETSNNALLAAASASNPLDAKRKLKTAEPGEISITRSLTPAAWNQETNLLAPPAIASTQKKKEERKKKQHENRRTEQEKWKKLNAYSC